MSTDKIKFKDENRITTRLDDDLIQFINSLSEQYKMPKSEVIRAIISGNMKLISECTKTVYADDEIANEIKTAIYNLSSLMSIYNMQLQQLENQLRKIGYNYNQELKWRKINQLPNLPVDAITNQIKDFKTICDNIKDQLSIYGEVLLCLIPR